MGPGVETADADNRQNHDTDHEIARVQHCLHFSGHPLTWRAPDFAAIWRDSEGHASKRQEPGLAGCRMISEGRPDKPLDSGESHPVQTEIHGNAMF